jgi:hypothetical protein
MYAKKILNIEICYSRHFVSIMPLFSLLQLEPKVCSFVSIMPFFKMLGTTSSILIFFLKVCSFLWDIMTVNVLYT